MEIEVGRCRCHLMGPSSLSTFTFTVHEGMGGDSCVFSGILAPGRALCSKTSFPQLETLGLVLSRS